MRFQSGRISIEICEATGSIVRIIDTKTDKVHFDALKSGGKDGTLFRLIIPSMQWSSRHADSQTSGRPCDNSSGSGN